MKRIFLFAVLVVSLCQISFAQNYRVWVNPTDGQTYLIDDSGNEIIVNCPHEISEGSIFPIGQNRTVRLTGADADEFADWLAALEVGIPFQSDALFWLDGTLDGDEFVDKSGNGRNFTITDKDFTASYFPYKSAATISAPVGDAVLIAADINNFLYDSGGDPNEIPVVSFFQNIDYENKIFSRHIAQVTDGNGVETTEPHVKDIAMYSAALTGADLTKANTYYGVPVEVTENVLWATKDGNDSTGDGSKSTPYLTIQKAIDQSSAGDTIYVKTGDYSETNANGGIYVNKGVDICFIGYSHLIPAGTGSYGCYIYSSATASVNGMIITDSSKNAMIRTRNAGNHLINRCYIASGSASRDALFSNDDHITYNITNSYIAGSIDTESDWVCTDVLFSSYATGNTFDIKNVAAVIQINNSKFTGSGTKAIQNAFAATSVTLKDCDILGVVFTSTVNATWDFNYCTIRANSDAAPFNFATAVQTAQIRNCTFVDENTASENAYRIITINGQHAVSVSNNSLSCARSIELYVINGTNAESVTINGNNFVSTGGGSAINVDKVNASIYDNIVISGGGEAEIQHNPNAVSGLTVSIYGNRIYGKSAMHIHTGNLDGSGNGYTALSVYENYLDMTDTPTGDHCIFIMNARNAQVYRNYVKNGGIGLVVKGYGDAFTAVAWDNLFENCNKSIINKGASSVKYYGNTIESTRTGAYASVAVGIVVNDDTEDNWVSDNVVMRNNIIKSTGTVAIDYGAGNSGLDSDYNGIYNPNGIALIAAVAKNWTEWQAAGNDANGFNTDPLLTDFIPQTGSPAIGAGETLAAAYDDGLDASTDWGDADTLPSVVTKQQTAPWDVGAYVK